MNRATLRQQAPELLTKTSVSTQVLSDNFYQATSGLMMNCSQCNLLKILLLTSERARGCSLRIFSVGCTPKGSLSTTHATLGRVLRSFWGGFWEGFSEGFLEGGLLWVEQGSEKGSEKCTPTHPICDSGSKEMGGLLELGHQKHRN